MKTRTTIRDIVLIGCFLPFTTIALFAQNDATDDDWENSGGNIITEVGFTGNVGIGTPNPNRLLHLNKNNTNAVRMRFTNNNSVNGGLIFGIRGNNAAQIRQREARPLIMMTNDIERIRITAAGFTGVGTNSPNAKLHVNNGGLLATGTGAGNPNLGAGTRMMWIPDLKAFRAGEATGLEWDDPNVGQGSAAFGENCEASGNFSFAAGQDCQATGIHSIAIGLSNQASGSSGVSLGQGGQAGNFAFSVGSNAHADGNLSFASGQNCTATGQFSIAMGRNNTTNGDFGIAMGDNNTTNFGGIALGNDNAATGILAVGIGDDNISGASRSVAIGQFLHSTMNGGITIGSGVSAAQRLVNNHVKALFVGFNSNIPTLFVGQSAGVGTTGRVGIGTTSPASKMHVLGKISMQDGTQAVGRIMVCTNTQGTAEWQDPVTAGLADADWFETGTTTQPDMITDNIYTDGRVTIGGNISDPDAKLRIDNTNLLGGLKIISNNPSSFFSRGADIRVLSPSTINEGIILTVDGAANINYGINAGAGSATTTSALNYAVRGSAIGSTNANHGGHFRATSTAGPNTGVYALAQNATVNNGLYAEAPIATFNKAGYFNGDVFRSGSDNFTSDARLKKDVKDMENALDIINALDPKTYQFKTEEYQSLHLPKDKQFGLIAQELQEVLPELVSPVSFPEQRDEEGNVISESFEFLTVEYVSLIPVLTAGIKEQQQIIEQQQRENGKTKDQLAETSRELNETKDELHTTRNEMDDLKEALEQMKESLRSYGLEVQQENVELEVDVQKVILNQNQPNPFKERTTIKYFVPEDVGEARIVFFDQSGKEIKVAPISQGFGSLEVFASDLSAGMYTYSIVTDGEIIQTLKMVVAE